MRKVYCALRIQQKQQPEKDDICVIHKKPPFFYKILFYSTLCDEIRIYVYIDTYSAEVYNFKEENYMENTALKLDKKTWGIVENYVPDGELLSDLTDFFSTFSDKTRLRILAALAISKTCVSDLSSVLGINQTTVSHQLRLLRNTGVVTCEREGKIIYYSLTDELVNEIMLKGVEFLAK